MSQEYWDLYYIIEGLGQIILQIIIPSIMLGTTITFLKNHS